jgi:hypothetical protein
MGARDSHRTGSERSAQSLGVSPKNGFKELAAEQQERSHYAPAAQQQEYSHYAPLKPSQILFQAREAFVDAHFQLRDLDIITPPRPLRRAPYRP